MKLVSPGMSMCTGEAKSLERRRGAIATTTTHKISYFIDFPGPGVGAA